MEMIVYRKGVPYICYYDAEDAPKIAGYKWHLVDSLGSLYVVSTKLQGAVKLHRLVMGFPDSDLDHRNRNGLDNRKKNLRLATHQENCRNRKKRSDGHTSKYKGVCYSPRLGKWVTQVDGKHVGVFLTELSAAEAYNLVAKAKHGEFALLNSIGGNNVSL